MKTLDVEAELKKELTLLQSLFGCAELNIEWKPDCGVKGTMFGKKNQQLCGEVVDRTIYVYVSELQDARHVADHEFIEYLLNKELLDPVVSLYNNVRMAMERSVTKQVYQNKEGVIENFVKLIEIKRKELESGGGEKKK